MAKGFNYKPYVQPALIIGGVYVTWRYVLAPLLETLNLKDTAAEAAAKKTQNKVETLPASLDYWSPNYFKNPPDGYTAIISNQAGTDAMAKKINNAIGLFNDDEQAIYGVFRGFEYKTQISWLAYRYVILYNADLYTLLKDKVLNDTELNTVLTITEKKLKGFKRMIGGVVI